MEIASANIEQVPDGECNEIVTDRDGVLTELDVQNGVLEGRKEFVAPAVGMEFESYDDAYNYYNCYAKEVGFRVRVKNSWFKRNSREKYGAVLCCSSQGFKRIKDVNRLRKETRTGCPAMLRMRLVDSKRWRVLEVTLEHNHLLGAKIYKSIKKVGSGMKRKSQSSSDAEKRTIKLYRALVIDSGGDGTSNSNPTDIRNFPDHPNQLNLKKVYTREIFKKFQFEVEEMYSCFSTTQLHVDGPIIIFLVKERVVVEGNRREIRDYEVLYNRTAGEVRCICSCFNFYGYLCRHALCVLNFNGVEEIPSKYILSRWKKDFKRIYIPDHGSSNADDTDRMQWFNQLYRSALQIVEEGVISLDHYKVALQAFEESLNRFYTPFPPRTLSSDGGKDSFNLLSFSSIGLSHFVRHALLSLLSECTCRFSGNSPATLRSDMDEVSLNTEPAGDDDADEFEIEGDCAMTDFISQTGIIQGENPLPPVVGMEFDSYEDVYYFYNCYAKQQGFGVRVSNTWYRKSKERYRGKLSCSSAGFKKKSEANRPRPETRTGCPAMIKFRLMDSNRWRVIEVELEHNHLISPASGKFYKSHKSVGVGTKRALQLDTAEEVQKIRLFRTVIIDSEDKYDQALQTHHRLEALADLDSRNSSYMLKSRCYFELQLAKVYTNDILRKFESEVEGMYSCFSTSQLNPDGPVITYIVKEQTEVDGNRKEVRDYEVLYNPSEMEVLCICGMFNLRGYLCRHTLSVLNQNGVEEIPAQYVLSRWRKDIKRNYIFDHSCSGIDINNPVHRYDHLYKCIVQVVEEGRKSQDRYKVAFGALDEILNKLCLTEDPAL
ncbi:hypothetical protein ACE6H2_010364 [Prunus campanulata]